MLRRVDWYLATDVSCDIGRLAFADGTNRLFRNVGNQLPTVRNFPEKQKCHLYCDESLEKTHTSAQNTPLHMSGQST
jgi:hypothetical protein